jgi:hypothetical protein
LIFCGSNNIRRMATCVGAEFHVVAAARGHSGAIGVQGVAAQIAIILTPEGLPASIARRG